MQQFERRNKCLQSEPSKAPSAPSRSLSVLLAATHAPLTHRNVCLRPLHELLHEGTATCLYLWPRLPVFCLPQVILINIYQAEVNSCVLVCGEGQRETGGAAACTVPVLDGEKVIKGRTKHFTIYDRHGQGREVLRVCSGYASIHASGGSINAPISLSIKQQPSLTTQCTTDNAQCSLQMAGMRRAALLSPHLETWPAWLLCDAVCHRGVLPGAPGTTHSTQRVGSRQH